MTRFLLPLAIAAAAAAAAPAPLTAAAAQLETPPPRRPVLAVAEVLAVNVAVNRFNSWVLDADWARVSGASVARNLRGAWAWDDDSFQTNMLAHPYHGGIYFNAGRANGLGFWGSVPLVLLGSLTWEYLGENLPPSRNDLIMTTFGGIAVGEMFHRMAASIRDNRDRGGSRTARELAALPLDPMTALKRLARGQWSDVGPNPREHDPQGFVLRLRAGGRHAPDSAPRLGAAGIDIMYGDPFRRPVARPYDAFGVRISLGAGLDLMRASGTLFGRELTDSQATVRHIFAVNHRFDYAGNPAQYQGGQSIEAGLYTRWRLGRTWAVRTQSFGTVTLLGAIDAGSPVAGARTYDFGSGAGVRLQAALERNAVSYITVLVQADYLRAVSRAPSDHVVRLAGLEVLIPLGRAFGLSAHATSFRRSSRYAGSQDRRDYPELRVLAVWTRTGFGPAEAP
jgi:hypothetical protein